MARKDRKLLMCFGGLGRNIMYTSALRFLNDPSISVIASYPDAFKGTPCSKIYDGSKIDKISNAYDELCEYDPINFDPYSDIRYRQGEDHFVQCVLRQGFGIGISRKLMPNPIVFIDKLDKQKASACLKAAEIGKKFLLLQTKGGTSYYSPEHSAKTAFQARHINVSYMADVARIAKEMGYDVLQFKLPNEERITGAKSFKKVLDHKTWCAIASMASKIICIDSSLMHMAAGLNKEALVFWGATNKEALGWDSNINITRKITGRWGCVGCGRPNTHFFDRPEWSCRFNFECGNYTREEIISESKKYLER